MYGSREDSIDTVIKTVYGTPYLKDPADEAHERERKLA